MKHCPFHDALIGDLQSQIRFLTKENNFFVNTCLKCRDCLNPTCPIRYRRKDIQTPVNFEAGRIIDINTGKSVDY